MKNAWRYRFDAGGSKHRACRKGGLYTAAEALRASAEVLRPAKNAGLRMTGLWELQGYKFGDMVGSVDQGACEAVGEPGAIP